MSQLRIAALAASLAVLVPAAAPAQTKLQLKVVTSSPGGFLVDSTLISGQKDAVLIDAMFTRADAHRLAADILESGKNLTTIYVTHAHPDHYFGLEVLKAAFPKARLVAMPGTVTEIEKTWKGKVDQWRPMFGEAIAAEPPIPEKLEGKTLELEGEKLEIKGPVQGDAPGNTYVYIKSLGAVIAGDVVYYGVHPWTAETDKKARKAWIATLDQIAKLKPTVVVAGHKKPDLTDDPASLKATKTYLQDFEKALSGSKTPEDLQAKMKAKYPDLALDVILQLGSQAQFKGKKK